MRIEIFLYCLIFSIYSKNNEYDIQFQLDSDGETFIFKEIQFLNVKEFPEEKKVKTAMICKITSFEDYIKNCYEKFLGFNKMWHILTDNLLILNEITYLDKNQRNEILSIITNKDLPAYNRNFNSFEIFKVNNQIFQKLEENDTKTDNKNSFLTITIKSYLKGDSPSNLIFFSVTNFVIMVLVYLWWYISANRLNTQYTTNLQKILFFLPFMRVVISGLLLLIFLLQEKYLSSDINTRDLLPSLVKLGSFIFKIIFWLLVILISKGFQLYRKKFTSKEHKILFAIYIVIFVSFCFDVLLQGVLNKQNFLLLNLEDLKNGLTFIFISCVVLFNVVNGLKRLREIQNYAQEYMIDYVPALLLKKRMLSQLAVMTCTYCLFYILLSIIVQSISNPIQFLGLFLFNFFENIVTIILLIIFRVRKYPEHFSVEYDLDIVEENQVFNIHKIFLPSFEEIRIKDYNKCLNINQKELKENKNKNSEFVLVINPIFENERNEGQNIIPYINLCYLKE